MNQNALIVVAIHSGYDLERRLENFKSLQKNERMMVLCDSYIFMSFVSDNELARHSKLLNGICSRVSKLYNSNK